MNRDLTPPDRGHERRSVAPLPGPLEKDPTAAVYALVPSREAADPAGFPAMDLARDMLTTAVAGVELGAYDRRILAWLADWDVPTVATVASLLHRCFLAGARTEAGR